MDSLVGQEVLVTHDVNCYGSTDHANKHAFRKGEIAKIIQMTPPGKGIAYPVFNCIVQSLDGKRSTVGNVYLPGVDVYHFILNTGAAKVLYGTDRDIKPRKKVKK